MRGIYFVDKEKKNSYFSAIIYSLSAALVSPITLIFIKTTASSKNSECMGKSQFHALKTNETANLEKKKELINRHL